jgi:putative membrane protein
MCRDSGDRRRACSFLMVFAVALKQHLRNERGLSELGSILSAQDIANIQQAKHMPLFCLDVMSYYLNGVHRSGEISSIQLEIMDKNLTAFEDTLGSCERIKKCPVPVAFVVHL